VSKENTRAVEPSTEIHPDDHMWNTGQDWYFSVGECALRVVTFAVNMSWLPRVTSILDLPCGHGRVARHLRSGCPEAQMYVCDIDPSGVDFCAETFNGIGIHSQVELTEVTLPIVDVIWVGSLFTHVDMVRTKRWLTYLAEHLTPHGVLVASFHGHWSVEMQKTSPMIDAESWDLILKSYQETGFGYAPYRDFDMGDYGVSLTRPGVVCDLVSAIPGVRLIGYMERGWADNHDVVMVTRNDRLRVWE
jgi:SAM-dependent methyltransferase